MYVCMESDPPNSRTIYIGHGKHIGCLHQVLNTVWNANQGLYLVRPKSTVWFKLLLIYN